MSQHSSMACSRTTTNAKAEQVYTHARIVCAQLWPFLTPVIMRLVARWSDAVPTMGVDQYWRLYMNPEFIASRNHMEIALLIAGHECQHLLGHHSERLTEFRDVFLVPENGKGAPVSLANVAHDIAINCGFQAFIDSARHRFNKEGSNRHAFHMKRPDDGCYAENFKTKSGQPFPVGKLSEEYAELLMRNTPKSNNPMKCQGRGDGNGNNDKNGKGSGSGDKNNKDGKGSGSGDKNNKDGKGSGSGDKNNKDGNGGKGHAPACGRCGSGGGGQREDYEDQDKPDPDDYNSGVVPEEQEVVRHQVANAIAEQAKRDRGSVPGHMVLWAEIILKPSTVSWQTILSRKVRGVLNKEMGRTDYSYQNPNRRSAGGKVILPGMYKPRPKFVVAMDTSGSMSKDDYAQVFGHIAAIVKSVGMAKVPVFTCDAAASEIQWVNNISQIQMVGGGGTDMGVAIQHAEETRVARLIIVMTDGITPWPKEKPKDMEVIVVLTQPPNKSWPVPTWATTVYTG